MKPAVWTNNRARCWKCVRWDDARLQWFGFVLAHDPRPYPAVLRRLAPNGLVGVATAWQMNADGREYWHDDDPRRPPFTDTALVVAERPPKGPGPFKAHATGRGTARRTSYGMLRLVEAPIVMVCPRCGVRSEVSAPAP